MLVYSRACAVLTPLCPPFCRPPLAFLPAVQMPCTVWVHSAAGGEPIRLKGVPDDAIVQDVKEQLEPLRSAVDMGFTVRWSLALASPEGLRQGAFLAADQLIAPAGAGTVLHVWVEPKHGFAAGEPWGPGSWAGGGFGDGLG